MSTKLPKSTDTNQTGRLGVTVLQERLEREGWIFRRQDGDSDFGVDGEIEIVDRNLVTGRLIKCQVKSSRTVEFENGEESVQVSVTTHNLWRATPLLTILFHVDTTSRAIYWTPALAHHPRAEAETLSIRFEDTSDISGSLRSLRGYLDSWFAVRSSEAIFREIVPFHRIYEELVKDIDHYDAWSEMPEEQEDSFRLFYGHALRLRLEVGLGNAEIPTIDDWYMRSEGVWNSAYPLFWGTFSEAMHVIRPAYGEALARITARLRNVELTVENQDLWNFIERQKTGRSVLHTMIDSRSSDPRFHARIEAKLKALKALKYPFGPRKS
jgi:hypothetical protein